MPREALEHVRRGIGSVCSQALEASWDWEWLLAEAGAPGQQALGRRPVLVLLHLVAQATSFSKRQERGVELEFVYLDKKALSLPHCPRPLRSFSQAVATHFRWRGCRPTAGPCGSTTSA